MADASDTPIIEHMTELPPDPPRLRVILAHLEQQLAETETVGIYLRLQRDAVRQALAATEKAPGRRPLPRPQRPALEAPAQQQASRYKVEEKLREGHPLGAAIHVADCAMPQRETRPIEAGLARDALTKDKRFFRACEFCTPEKTLGLEG
jgi:hypothetical protein